MKESKGIQQKEFKNDYIKACINILYTSSFMVKLKTDTLKPFNISLPQFNILNLLNNQSPSTSTVKLLADQMLNKTSNVSRLIEKLRVKGLIHREISEIDRRKVKISLTPLGFEVFKEAVVALDNITEFQLSNLTQQEVVLLNKLLTKTRNSMTII